MNSENIKILADGIKEYFSQYELEDLCRRLDITIEYSGTSPNMRRLAGDALAEPHKEPNNRFLKTVLGELTERCQEQIQNATREDNLYHQQMSLQLGQLRQSLMQNKPSGSTTSKFIPKHIPEQSLSPRSSLVAFFSQAQTVVTIVDCDPGAGTLDGLRQVEHPVQLLTTDPPGGFDKNFIRTLTFFRDRGKRIELRLSNTINNVTVLFNQRCWLFSCPLKDAAEGKLNMIEIIDGREAIAGIVESNWDQAELLVIA